MGLGLKKLNKFVICGRRSVLEALNSQRSYRWEELIVIRGHDEPGPLETIVAQAKRRHVPVRHVDGAHLERLAPGVFNHQGVALVLSQAPPTLDWESFLGQAAKAESALVVALDSISDHQNVGAIARLAAGFGALGLVAPQDRSAPLVHPAVWRVAQGACEHLDFVAVPNLVRALEQLKEHRFWIVGASSQKEAPSLAKPFDWPKKLCLVLGSEEKGLRRLIQESCDYLVWIAQETPGGLDSLNVSHAAAIILWEIYKFNLRNSIGKGRG